MAADPSAAPADSDDLLAVIAHSLLGSVSVIVGGSEMLTNHWAELPEHQRTDLLVRIRNQGRHVAAVLDNLIRLGDPGLIEALDRLQQPEGTGPAAQDQPTDG